MRATLPVLAALLTGFLAPACGPLNVQQQAGFGRAAMRAAKDRGHVGELVRFDLRPPVSRGTEWDLDAYHRVRFVGAADSTHLFWVAEHEPIHLETIVAPWDAKTDREQSTSWLWFALREAGDKQPIHRPVPVETEPYRELSPVSFTSVFTARGDGPRLRHRRTAQRNEIAFRTARDVGSPRLPRVRAALVETAGNRILYAEIHLDFGDVRKEQVGYETTLSYPLDVAGPVEVVVVEWVGRGDYYRPFQVHRMEVPH